MASSVLALIGATIVFTSFLSGVFGMAGGMILLGVLLNYFDVATAMILFSIIQLFANGWRVVQWRSYVLWPIFGWYVLGAAISFAGMWMIAFVPDKAMVYLALGLMPFAVEALPTAMRPNIEWRGVPFVTGVATTIIQILAGVGGLFLDIFFQKSALDARRPTPPKPSRNRSATSCGRSISDRYRVSETCRCGPPVRRSCWRSQALRLRPSSSSA
jgi:uncharacterized protein